MIEVINSKKIAGELGLHRPAMWKRVLESLSLREVTPVDICPKYNLGRLYAYFPDLMGDNTAIGIGDDGMCQSWRGHRRWYRSLLA
ncbi:MAG: hypothetical protein US86_C0001G0024 [Candidatus Daviesbacteria bacterium GW2011_GWA2_38_24]|uniref:Uncharacterized protein n=1 Tax=Candidatus Daviesbacteria bacterium GW2011_GWA2_38_24 TaxID=1618422 RepID=A0A0G0JJW4_9BACT|nr:MAG: hypothetical protein US86_C0001G0024 [Candidatus Daviesbacteria bacterium GW2011_GWA2_38_24]KKQ80149.1 MAG: hypothetical protein UT01_C0018G0014 [Candidatus Daviesbacteria bacterium GW2011_GWA1_38_7]